VKPATTHYGGVAPEQAETELEAILDIADNGFVIYEPSGAIRLASKRIRQLLSLDEAEWASLRDFPAFARVLGRRLANNRQVLRPPWVLWQQRNGSAREQLELLVGERILERTVRPIGDETSQTGGWVERYRDATAERELPARLLQTDKLAALGQMVAGIAHELNNPLTTVMGYSHLLLDQPLDRKVLSEVHHISQEAERAARIVRSLLMLAREAKLERTAVNVNEVVERTLRLCAYDLHRAGIAVDLDLDPLLPAIPANPVQFQQVVLNLLVNSQQAVREASRPGRITLRTRHGADHVYLHVEDNGPGIPLELQARIFEPFFTTKPVGVGTGLGLSIVTGILRQHGGEIHVASASGAGTTFTIELPVAQDQETGSISPREAEAGSAAPAGRILVIEDETGIGQLIVDALTGQGHRVELITEPKEALKQAAQVEYDLVICDWRLLSVDGPELYRLLGTGSRPRRERILVLTPDPSIASSSEFLRQSKLPTLAKPFLLTELKAEVTRLLTRESRRVQTP
jgi:two-component system NtrC family sensor kinase